MIQVDYSKSGKSIASFAPVLAKAHKIGRAHV